MIPIAGHPLLRARIASAGAMRLARQTLVDIDIMIIPTPSLWTHLRDRRTCVHATLRLVDACLARRLPDRSLVDLVIAALQRGNQRGWQRACTGKLPDYDFLLEALESEIAQHLDRRLAEYRPALSAIGALDWGCDQSVVEHALRTARTLTNGNSVLATHLLIGATLMALRDAA